MAEPTYEELKAQLEALKSQQSRKPGDFGLKVSEKGGQRVWPWPVPSYAISGTVVETARPRG
jgi:hypothetical protein